MPDDYDAGAMLAPAVPERLPVQQPWQPTPLETTATATPETVETTEETVAPNA
jgi:hypothetical protein